VTHQPGATQADVEMGCLLPPADARRAAIYDVVADLTSAALTDTLREDTGATYGVHASQATARGGTAALRVSGTIDKGRLPMAMAVLRGFWFDTGSHGVADKYVKLSRDTQAAGHLLRYETSEALVDALVGSWNRGWPLTWIDDEPALFAGVRKADV